jgi:asparagine synthase (glutamine-hydrolysing)
MCGIAGTFGKCDAEFLRLSCGLQRHRGPDDEGVWQAPDEGAGLAHTRLSIIDLSAAGHQPMASPCGRYRIVFNGEIYNYRELRAELSERRFATRTDTEVILAAYERWGAGCLDRLVGMFAFLIWDSRERRLFAARDRFGVKPLYYREAGGTLYAASETRTLRAAAEDAAPDASAWAAYLAHGQLDNGVKTFWSGISAVPPGHYLTWQDGRTATACWYDLPARSGSEFDDRPEGVVEEEYLALLEESVRLRFRADVPVGINVSGGLDSSMLLSLVARVGKDSEEVTAFTFVTGDPNYDELPWVEKMIARTRHPLKVCRLKWEDVPAIAEDVQKAQDEPFGGLPTLAYARVFEEARAEGTLVLLDGQGMDEQWAGYDYYRAPGGGEAPAVQGTKESPVRPDCLAPGFRALAGAPETPAPYPDRLRNLQFRDIRYAKIPRALRFNDRVSMRSSTELREPFLDHRLFELALRQPEARKIRDGEGKCMLRSMARTLIPESVAYAPKRPLQTPQREWLRGPLSGWARDSIAAALDGPAGCWFDGQRVRAACEDYFRGAGDNSFFMWQWISVGMILEQQRCAQIA